MKSLHRTKALAAYDGARLTLNNNMAYPTYMLLKESARGILSYIAEEKFGYTISDKTKLSRLIEFLDEETINIIDLKNIQKLIDVESNGLQAIISINTDDLEDIKRTLKGLIIYWFREPV